MEWIAYIVAALFVLLGAACLVLVVLSLPGGWVMLGLGVVINLLDGLYLPETAAETFPWWLLACAFALLCIGELIEFVAGIAGAKRGGATKRGMIGSLIGGIVGAIVLSPLIPIPIVGALIGALVGTFVGAVIGELGGASPMTVRGSMKPAIGASIGRIVGTTSKLGIAIAAWIVMSVAAFWP